jgi:predicted KAP-like P-loop ATPase
MFSTDKPITKSTEDILGRGKFVAHLVNSLNTWNETDPLVIGLYGEWGTGKTSVLNMMLHSPDLKKDRFDIINFAPWMLSESDNLLDDFINELSSVKKTGSRLLKKYAKIISHLPNKEVVENLANKFTIIIAGLGLEISAMLQFFSEIPESIRKMILIAGISIGVIGVIINKIILPLTNKTKSVNDIKNDIKKKLEKSKKKLLIIIDDIDRLTPQEMRQIFRIVRTNADFPKTIYLLAFDRNVVEKAIDVPNSISGHDYLEKIIQVNFTLPSISSERIKHYLFNELDRLIEIFPQMKEHFADISYFQQVFNSGLRDYFQTIRTVKRFINSLEFNFQQVIQNDVVEVNPVDFMAIEAIRLFEPQFYQFLSQNKDLFTTMPKIPLCGTVDQSDVDTRKKILDEYVGKANLKVKLQELLNCLFPIVGSGFSSSGAIIDNSLKNTNVCSPAWFDVYFNFIPGGSDHAVTKYDEQRVSMAASNYNDLSALFQKYIEEDKFTTIIHRLNGFVDDDMFFKKENYGNIVLCLLNSFNKITIKRSFAPFSDIDYQIVLLIHKLLTRKPIDLTVNFMILENTINESTSLYGMTLYLAFEIEEFEKKAGTTWEQIMSDDNIAKTKQLCADKISKERDNILKKNNPGFILYRWRKWGDEKDCDKYTAELLSDDEKFLKLAARFTNDSMSTWKQEKGIVSTIHHNFDYNGFKEFIALEAAKERMEKIKGNTHLYQQYQQVIDLFLKNYENGNLLTNLLGESTNG